MRWLFRLGLLSLAGYGASELWKQWSKPQSKLTTSTVPGPALQPEGRPEYVEHVEAVPAAAEAVQA